MRHKILQTRRRDTNFCAFMKSCEHLCVYRGLQWEPKDRKERGVGRCKCKEQIQVFLLRRTKPMFLVQTLLRSCRKNDSQLLGTNLMFWLCFPKQVILLHLYMIIATGFTACSPLTVKENFTWTNLGQKARFIVCLIMFTSSYTGQIISSLVAES